jgi:hypothetical protein
MAESHGHTVAAWTAVTVMFVGFMVAGLAVVFALPWLFWVGIVVVAAGAVVGKVLQMMGMGQTVAYQDHHDPEYSGSDAPTERPLQPPTGHGSGSATS